VIHPQRIGRFLHADRFGYVQPDVAMALVGSTWKPLVDFVTNSLMMRKDIRSVYLRGSIPRGLAIEDVSDADFSYISERDFAREDAILETSVKTKFAFVREVKIFRLNRTELDKVHHPQRRPYFHMLLKTQSLFLAGDDITRNIEPFRLGPDMVSHVFWLADEFFKTPILVSKMSSMLEESQKAVIERSARRWISKRIVRSGFEITLDRNNRFTRDLYLCYEEFSRLYPAQSKQMYRTLINSLNGNDDPIVHRELVAFLTGEAARLHTTSKNPARTSSYASGSPVVSNATQRPVQ
jgi:uncharacterized protein